MFLGRDRIVHRGRDDLEIRDVELVSARRAAVGAHHAMHDERGLLRQVIGLLELLVADRGLRDDGLDEAAAVAHREEMNLAARAPVVKPAPDGHRSALRAWRFDLCRQSFVCCRAGVPGQIFQPSIISASSRVRALTAFASTA